MDVCGWLITTMGISKYLKQLPNDSFDVYLSTIVAIMILSKMREVVLKKRKNNPV